MKLTVALLLTASSFAVMAETKIATLNANYILAKAPQNDVVKQRLQSQFTGRQNELKRLVESLQKERDSLVKNATTMSETQITSKKRDLDKKYADLQLKDNNLKEDMERATRAEQKKLGEQIKKAIDAVSIRGGFNLVIKQQAAVFVDVSIPDITEQVLAELKK